LSEPGTCKLAIGRQRALLLVITMLTEYSDVARHRAVAASPACLLVMRSGFAADWRNRSAPPIS